MTTTMIAKAYVDNAEVSAGAQSLELQTWLEGYEMLDSESIAGNGLIADDGQITFPFTRHDPGEGDLPILEMWVLGWYAWELVEWCVVRMHKRGEQEFWVDRGGFPVDMPTYWFDLPSVVQ